MEKRSALVGAGLMVVLAGAPALAEDAPMVGRLGIMLMPLAPPAIGGELEVGLQRFPLTLGLRSVGFFPSPPMPSYHALIARTTPVHPAEGAAFGLLGAAALLSMTSTPGGRSTTLGLAVGLTYQQAWGNAWLRLSPNVMFPPNLLEMLMIGPPWLEIGYDLGGVEVSLRSTATPLGLAFRF